MKHFVNSISVKGAIRNKLIIIIIIIIIYGGQEGAC